MTIPDLRLRFPSLRSVLTFVQSDEAVLVVLGFALIAQIPHTASVLYHATQPIFSMHWLTWAFAYLGALAIDVAVFMFVLRGKIIISWLFAAFAIMVNLVHFWNPAYANVTSEPGVYTSQIAGVILAAILIPLVIALYSHEVDRRPGLSTRAHRTAQDAAKPSSPEKDTRKPPKARKTAPTAPQGKSRGKTKEKIVSFLRENGGKASSASEIAEGLNVAVSTVTRSNLPALIESGEVVQDLDTGEIRLAFDMTTGEAAISAAPVYVNGGV